MKKQLEALGRPLIIIVILSTVHIYIGTITWWFGTTAIRFPLFWAWFAVFAGFMGLCSIYIFTKLFVVTAGCILVLAGVSRSLAITERAMDHSLSPSVRAAAAIGSIQWLLLSYLTLVIWQNIILPWSVLRGDQYASQSG